MCLPDRHVDVVDDMMGYRSIIDRAREIDNKLRHCGEFTEHISNFTP